MDTSFVVTIDEKGTIRVPDNISAQLGLLPGMSLVVEQDEGNGISLRIDPDEARLVDKEGVLVIDAEPLVDVTQFIHLHRSERISHLSGES